MKRWLSRQGFRSGGDRQAAVLTMLVLGLGIAVPIAVGAVLILAFGWALVLGASNPHGDVFGWASKETVEKGHTVYQPAGWIFAWWVAVGTLCFLYEGYELVTFGYSKFERALVGHVR